MKRLMFQIEQFPLMDKAPAPTGEGAPGSAAAAIATDGGTPPSTTTPPTAPAAETPADLSKMSDEDYAKAVIPDAKEGEPEADRSLITPMAKELREMGVQPAQMAKIAALYSKTVRAELAKDEAARAERMKELAAKCMAEITADEKKNFAAAYRDHIAKDAELKHIVDHTELGSNPAFIRLIALAGATLRAETPAPATAAGGTSTTDTDAALFNATVRKEYR